MEGQRLFDLRRYGNAYASAAINGYLTGIGGGREDTRRKYLANAETFGTRHQLYPIPNIEVQLSKVGDTPMLTQNTGW